MSQVLRKPVTALLLALAVVLFTISLVPGILRIKNLNNRVGQLEQELAKLRSEDKALETELRLLRDDPVYLEKVARAQFNKAKQGEIVYKVVRENPAKEN